MVNIEMIMDLAIAVRVMEVEGMIVGFSTGTMSFFAVFSFLLISPVSH